MAVWLAVAGWVLAAFMTHRWLQARLSRLHDAESQIQLLKSLRAMTNMVVQLQAIDQRLGGEIDTEMAAPNPQLNQSH